MKNGWKSKRLGAICEFVKEQGEWRDLPYVGLEHIESNTGRFLGSRLPRTVKSTTFRFNPEHVLYGRLRPYLNKVLLPDFEGHCSTEIFPIRTSDELHKRYLFHWLRSDEVVAKINATWTGARMPRANMNQVLDFPIPVPPIEEQRRIVAILDEAFACIDKAKANTEKNIQNARELFDSYLNNIFSNPGLDWETSTLEDSNRFIDYRGKTPVKTESGIRLITAKNVKPGYLTQEPEEFIARNNYESWMTRGIPQKGDVLFTTEAPLANVAQLDTDEKVAFAQRVIILQPNRKKLDDRFLKYQLLSKPAQEKIMKHGSGATVQGIKAKLLKTVEIAFPPSLSEQTDMADLLDIIWDECWNAEDCQWAKIDELETLKKSILQKAFAGEIG